jgi:Flp pilus assembly protein TadG
VTAAVAGGVRRASVRPSAPLRGLRRLARSERGAAVVEFAVVVPVLLVLVMGIIDFGRMYAVAASLAAATRDGARQGATATDLTDATQLAAIKARVVSGFQPLGGTALTAANVSVTLDGSYNVVVTVSNYRYVPITPIASLVGLGTVTLNRTALFRWERTL